MGVVTGREIPLHARLICKIPESEWQLFEDWDEPLMGHAPETAVEANGCYENRKANFARCGVVVGQLEAGP